MKIFAQENQINFIDLTEKFLAKGDVDRYYLLPKDPHLSAEDNSLVANEMYVFLKHILIPRNYEKNTFLFSLYSINAITYRS